MTREYSPQPGANWQTVVRQVETVVPDGEETRPNRATRRAAARAKRKDISMTNITPMGHAGMICDGCKQPCTWNPWGRCSWSCFDVDRETPEEHAAMQEAAPEAFAFFMGIGPGTRISSSE